MKKSESKKLDAMWREVIRDNFNNRCVICRKQGKLDAHHYIGRRNRATRWYIPNGILLCSGHHTLGVESAHQHPEWFRKQMLDLWGDKWLDDLIEQGNKIFKNGYESVAKHLSGINSHY